MEEVGGPQDTALIHLENCLARLLLNGIAGSSFRIFAALLPQLRSALRCTASTLRMAAAPSAIAAAPPR